MHEKEALRIWQTVTQKEIEMKTEQELMDEQIRNLDLKTTLMDLRIETAFKIRNDYLHDLTQRYPDFKPAILQHASSTYNVSECNKTELGLAALLEKDVQLEVGSDGKETTLYKITEGKIKQYSDALTSNSYNAIQKTDLLAEIVKIREKLVDISAYLKEIPKNRVQQLQLGSDGVTKPKEEQEQAKTVISISRRQSFRDNEYSATEHISLPPAHPQICSLQPQTIKNPANETIENKHRKSEHAESEGNEFQESPKFSGPRPSFDPVEEQRLQNKSGEHDEKLNTAVNQKTLNEISEPDYSVLKQPNALQSTEDPMNPNRLSSHQDKNQVEEPKPYEITSSSSESTPASKKSTTLLKSYQILLGKDQGDKIKEDLDSLSDASSDEIEADLQAGAQDNKAIQLHQVNQSPNNAASPPNNHELITNPDEFLAKLFPEKSALADQSTKSVGQMDNAVSKNSPYSFGNRKPKKSAFFNMGEESDSDSMEITKATTAANDFDFFN